MSRRTDDPHETRGVRTEIIRELAHAGESQDAIAGQSVRLDGARPDRC